MELSCRQEILITSSDLPETSSSQVGCSVRKDFNLDLEGSRPSEVPKSENWLFCSAESRELFERDLAIGWSSISSDMANADSEELIRYENT
ncbi:hypothetical protein OGAPHI_007379 [Ogataea philodendri]|uniref:Uncharacterized protein n=1 Tax=Ogataea philodendri TaxID=1378263 RepID=A0A9P8NVG0_9ASCO|nr:uncharacterized protein OGAPHI_007379 [Ogataea philodendri]KAH3660174.1 hypothetical protein OGAPHI_007379 [Ogataea philodendri]